MIRLAPAVVLLLLAAPVAAQNPGASGPEPQRLEPITALAIGLEETATYQRCLDAVGKTPDYAFEQALAWRDAGGGNAARHCVAAALLRLGQPAPARRDCALADCRADRTFG